MDDRWNKIVRERGAQSASKRDAHRRQIDVSSLFKLVDHAPGGKSLQLTSLSPPFPMITYHFCDPVPTPVWMAINDFLIALP